MRFRGFAQAIRELASHGRLSEQSQVFLDEVLEDKDQVYSRFERNFNLLREEVQQLKERLTELDSRKKEN